MSARTVITLDLEAILSQCLSPAALYSSGLGTTGSWDSFFMKACLARMTPMLKVTVFRAEMDLVKANMLVLRDLTGAEAGGEDTRFILESPEISEEDEDVSEENDDSEEVGDPEWEPSSSITLSSPMDAILIRNFLSMMLALNRI